jgi:hypothetical protein
MKFLFVYIVVFFTHIYLQEIPFEKKKKKKKEERKKKKMMMD